MGLNPEVILNLSAEELHDELLHNDDLVKTFVQDALKFQHENVRKAEDFVRKFDESLLKENADYLIPEFLVLPYLTVDENNYEKILKISQTFLNAGKKVHKRSFPPVFGMLNFSKKVLKDDGIRNMFINYIKDDFFKGIIVWIDGFSEREEELELVKSFISLVKEVRETGKRVHILNGGYFSLLLTHYGVTSVSHGIGIWGVTIRGHCKSREECLR